VATVAIGTIIIPAHNEAAVIESCLRSLYEAPIAEKLDVVVSCNGCTDGTAERVRRLGYPVRVAESDTPSKPAALRLAESMCNTFPRLYLDADVLLPTAAAVAVLDCLREAGRLAARPPLRYDTSRSSAVVRRFYRARASAPSLTQALWGAGVYALSETGRARFREFPDILGDDLFIDRLFVKNEKEIVQCAAVTVRTPGNTRDLLAILRRNYRGNREAVKAMPGSSGSSWRSLWEILNYGTGGLQQMVDAAL
jgi:glycosyltransferase involved in cell wall biosynthesis